MSLTYLKQNWYCSLYKLLAITKAFHVSSRYFFAYIELTSHWRLWRHIGGEETFGSIFSKPFCASAKTLQKHTLNVVCMSYTTFKVNMWQVLIELFVITVEIFAETSFFMWFLLVSSKTFRSAIPENVSTKRLFYFILTYADTTRNL